MPADIVNLRRARKAKSRDDTEREAAANRLLFGRTKGEKAKQAAERERAARVVDGHRRDKD
jgi:hypothetical protein